ncbi:MAG: prenyltransferase [Methanobacteriaceae archaeon]|nr:prenyltransferase [Methanobacteriaceae archaeon]
MNREDLINILKLGRFHFIMAGFFSFTAGSLLAVLLNVPFSLDRFILGYLVLMPAHLSVSYSNDYFDVEVDKHGQPTLFTGGSGILVKHPHLQPWARRIALTLIGCSIILALLFTIYYQVPLFLVLSFMGIFLAWYYSATPLQLSYRGWGELAMVASGFIIPSLGFLALAGYINLQSTIFTLPLMCYQVMFIMSVEIPDLESDLKGGKHTYVANHGRLAGFRLAGIFACLATILFLLIGFFNLFMEPDFKIVALISLLPTVLALWSWHNSTSQKEKATRLATYNLVGLFTFIIILNVYFWTLL